MKSMTRMAAVCCMAMTMVACGAGLGEESSSSGSGGSGGSGSSTASSSAATQEAALKACAAAKYTGTETDPQVYTYDYIAQFDRCALAATGDSKYKTDGDNQCRVLNGLINATGSRFKPIYCNGAVMRA